MAGGSGKLRISAIKQILLHCTRAQCVLQLSIPAKEEEQIETVPALHKQLYQLPSPRPALRILATLLDISSPQKLLSIAHIARATRVKR